MRVIVSKLIDGEMKVVKDVEVLKIEPGPRGVSYWTAGNGDKTWNWFVRYDVGTHICILP